MLSGRREAELRKTAGMSLAQTISLRLNVSSEMCRWEQLIVPGDLSKEEDVKALFERTIETFGV